MLVDDKPTTAVFTDPDSPDIDQAQYRSGKGPCLKAFRTGQIQAVDTDVFAICDSIFVPVET